MERANQWAEFVNFPSRFMELESTKKLNKLGGNNQKRQLNTNDLQSDPSQDPRVTRWAGITTPVCPHKRPTQTILHLHPHHQHHPKLVDK